MSAYNAALYIEESVNSILEQTFNDFEFIIINDGSTDKTKTVLESFRDGRIIVVDQEHSGLTKALNHGLSRARGTYIARMDADDISLPERLACQVQFLEENPYAGFVGCQYYEINYRGDIIQQCRLPTENEHLQKSLKAGNQFVHGAVVFRKACIKAVGGYREFFRFAQDFDLWLRIAQQYQCANIALPLYKLRINPCSQLYQSLKSEQDQCFYAACALLLAEEREKTGSDRLQQCTAEEYPLVKDFSFEGREDVLAKIYFTTSNTLLRRGDIAQARLLARKACIHDPLRWKFWKHLLSLYMLSNFLKLHST